MKTAETLLKMPQNRSEMNSDCYKDKRSEYRFESARRESFANWPVTFLDPKKLAEAGFYYTNEVDMVRCFECGLGICKWADGDDPQFEHQRWFERCRFVRKIPRGNVPVGTDPADIPPSLPRARGVRDPYGIDIRIDSGLGCCSASSNLHLLNTAQCQGVPEGSLYPQFGSYDGRLNTFKFWPEYTKQAKEELADAGFFYTGEGDQTLCHHCGGGLRDWKPLDNPWRAHVHWFPKCCYLISVKGQGFVDHIKGLSRNRVSARSDC